ncbi:surfeit locus protein 6 [Megalops cyprinoides]|uniref:surfeit locus protein 6 n=1 Tax=Megalops cyprinoides TaxID=118141 RepID=UPI0018640E4B|nr:surfeit locus protein 6 [Megalops cyprinoides]
MASLASKDTYLQKLGSKVCASQNQEARKRPFAPYWSAGEAGAPKKKKNRQKLDREKSFNRKDRKSPIKTDSKAAVHPAQAAEQSALPVNAQNGTALKKPEGPKGGKSVASSFFAVDLLRQRLHDKIKESHGHGNSEGVSSEEISKKRERRRQERERKKRKRKEFRMKKLAEKAEEAKKKEDGVDPSSSTAGLPAAAEKEKTTLVFNRVEVGEEYVDKVQLKKEKKKKIKGNLTPLTGKNYKQLLTRVEARKAKLEELRAKDEGKAKEVENKMKWTNVLYKAEGLKIKDNEDLLRTSLKRKEKMRSQRKKRWEQRSVHILEKMQHRQDKRRKNIQKQKRGKVERRKEKARKKGRVLPEDLKKA